MAVTAASPFVGLKDQNLSIAYCSAFILVFMVNCSPYHISLSKPLDRSPYSLSEASIGLKWTLLVLI